MTWFLLFFALFLLATCDKTSDEVVSLEGIKKTSKVDKDLLMAIQGLISEVYESDKLGSIQEVVNSFKEDKDTANVTLIAFQNVYDDDRTLKEIRTIELSIPNIGESSVISLDLKDTDSSSGFDSDDLDQIREARDTFEALSILGIDMDLIYAERDDEGNSDVILMSKNFMMLKSSDVTFINQTIELDSIKEVKAHVENHIGNTPSSQKSVLMYDKDGKFLKERSVVAPEITSSVSGLSGEVDNVLLVKSLDALSHAVLESDRHDYKQVPEKVRAALTEQFPDIFFVVTGETPASVYMSNDFTIDLQYDLLDLQDALKYTVYGYNRTVSAK